MSHVKRDILESPSPKKDNGSNLTRECRHLRCTGPSVNLRRPAVCAMSDSRVVLVSSWFIRIRRKNIRNSPLGTEPPRRKLRRGFPGYLQYARQVVVVEAEVSVVDSAATVGVMGKDSEGWRELKGDRNVILEKPILLRELDKGTGRKKVDIAPSNNAKEDGRMYKRKRKDMVAQVESQAAGIPLADICNEMNPSPISNYSTLTCQDPTQTK
ncbi:hypothetical protein EDB80DRAFT_683467 [Ilyonectria destructans]|nr:hypothetical protein EDB80DRAFT_683467 [Ilyonectria destructans]